MAGSAQAGRAVPRWRRGFLRRLAASGNATLAAKRSGVARTWVYRWRREEAAFAAEWQEAVERFERRARRRAGGAAGKHSAVRRPAAPAREGPLIARRTRGGRPQLALARASDWSGDKEADFFAELGATLNVTAASSAAGFTSKTAWARRRTDAAFARRWDAVMEEGADRLELRLMELAANDIGALADRDAAGADAVAEARPPDPDLAKWLLRFRRDCQAKSAGHRPGRGMRRAPDLDALHDEVLRRLEALRRHRGG